MLVWAIPLAVFASVATASANLGSATADGGATPHPRQVDDRVASLAIVKLVDRAGKIQALALYETMNPPAGAERVAGSFVRRTRPMTERQASLVRQFFSRDDVFDKFPEPALDFSATYAFRFRTGADLVTLVIDECITLVLPVRSNRAGTEIGRKQFLTTPARPELRKLLTTIYGKRPTSCGG